MNKFTSVIISCLLVCVALNAEARPQLFGNLLSMGTSAANSLSSAASSMTAAASSAASNAVNTGLSLVPGGTTSTTNSTTALQSGTDTMSALSTGMQDTISKGVEEGQDTFNKFVNIFTSWGTFWPKLGAKVMATQAVATADNAISTVTG